MGGKKQGSVPTRGIWLVSGHAASWTGSSNRPPPTLHRVAWCHRALASSMGRVHRTNTKETRGARVTGRVIPSCIGFQGIGFQNLPIYFYTQHEEVRSRIRNPTRQTKVSCSLPMTNTHTHTQKLENAALEICCCEIE